MRKAAFLAVLLAAAPAVAQAPMPMQHGAGAAADSPEAKALSAAMARMHESMNVPPTGDADRDFVNAMIPHHQGAIEMARIELHYGKDEQLRALARQIIAAQEKEIALMKRWQAKNGEKHAQ